MKRPAQLEGLKPQPEQVWRWGGVGRELPSSPPHTPFSRELEGKLSHSPPIQTVPTHVPSSVFPAGLALFTSSHPAQSDLGILVGLHISLSNPADQGGVMWVLSIGLIIHLQGLLRLVGKLSGVSLFSPAGGVNLGGHWQGHEAFAHLLNIHESITQ